MDIPISRGTVYVIITLLKISQPGCIVNNIFEIGNTTSTILSLNEKPYVFPEFGSNTDLKLIVLESCKAINIDLIANPFDL